MKHLDSKFGNDSPPAESQKVREYITKDPSSEDQYWWQRLTENDSEALSYFYNKYADWLLRYGLSVVYERAIVSDAVQELFLLIWKSRHRLAVPRSVEFYLMASIRRIILKAVRADQVLCDPLEEVEDIHTTDYSEEIHMAVNSAVRSLPPRQQELIFLKYYQKMNYEQISDLTGLDNQILRNTIHRAVKSLRLALRDQVDFYVFLIFLIFL